VVFERGVDISANTFFSAINHYSINSSKELKFRGGFAGGLEHHKHFNEDLHYFECRGRAAIRNIV